LPGDETDMIIILQGYALHVRFRGVFTGVTTTWHLQIIYAFTGM